ncbi:uncharacterized protein LOC128907644 [Rissa tridactyla]|uniref:uncharacterized protein LOC128907644 n=1 Tax=Rissa tridactyla TaxID=75485 RepID=UPI0023BAE17D|nr:uncharacterized protein LOC128907644 [Rissa tridactyla]
MEKREKKMEMKRSLGPAPASFTGNLPRHKLLLSWEKSSQVPPAWEKSSQLRSLLGKIFPGTIFLGKIFPAVIFLGKNLPRYVLSWEKIFPGTIFLGKVFPGMVFVRKNLPRNSLCWEKSPQVWCFLGKIFPSLTEPPNWKGPSETTQSHQSRVTQSRLEMGLECLQRWRLHTSLGSLCQGSATLKMNFSLFSSFQFVPVSPCPTCWPRSSGCPPGDHWPSWPPGHMAGSWATCCPPGLPGPSLQSCSAAGQPQPVLVRGVVPPQGQDPTLARVELHRVPLHPTLHLPRSGWMVARPSGVSPTPPSLVSPANTVPSPSSLMTILNRI